MKYSCCKWIVAEDRKENSLNKAPENVEAQLSRLYVK